MRKDSNVPPKPKINHIDKLTTQLAAEVGLLVVLPALPAARVDLRYAVERQRLAVQKCAEALKEIETELNNWFIENLPKEQSSGLAGQQARIQLKTKIMPQVEDWNKLYKHIQKTGEFELLQRRLGDGAIKERWEAKKDVPGVGHFNAITVSCTKL